MKLELLSPAKNLQYGIEAVNHGADALYIGAPSYGARQAATNTIEDISRLVRYAHLFGAKVFATVNTLLFDDEMEPAVAMIRQLYNEGVDALIVQDMGLLECDLPPIALHASTQCHNSTPERVKFMESVGMRRVILARETSLEQIKAIREATSVEIESFVHGALCVSYSGQCYISQYVSNRSGNRGACTQPCRSRYDLVAADGRTLVKDRHLLSLKDFNASQHLVSMIDAGVSSFKIEGRLKDLSYVKNITAYYRSLLDSVMEGRERASSGKCTFYFTPDPERTFNRGFTDYFLCHRQPMASIDTQKSRGKKIGTVLQVEKNALKIKTSEQIVSGDGLCWFDEDNRLQGFLVNEVHGSTVVPNRMPEIHKGAILWRNNDHQFEQQLQGRTAERRVGVRLGFAATSQGFCLSATDEDGIEISHAVEAEHIPSDNPGRMSELVVKQLSKLGGTPFEAMQVDDNTRGQWFLTIGMLNEMRRTLGSMLENERTAHFRPADVTTLPTSSPFPSQVVDYRANVVNRKAEQFYQRHGASVAERGLEQTAQFEGHALMTTKYCIRFELGCCRCGKSQNRPRVNIGRDEELYLLNNGRRYRLEFDCRECLMRLYPDSPVTSR